MKHSVLTSFAIILGLILLSLTETINGSISGHFMIPKGVWSNIIIFIASILIIWGVAKTIYHIYLTFK